ncbi:hypothetical protein ACM9HF_04520 [Colwellia sp. RE-S-Sl-9]
MKVLTILFLFTFLSFDLLACSISGYRAFTPSQEEWQQHAGPAQSDPSSLGEYWESVPTPQVKVLRIVRATESRGSSCGDAGLIEFEITLPPKSTYKIDEFGLYFKLIKGDTPDLIFPDTPVKGRILSDRKAILLFPWLDAPPSKQYQLDLTVDVFFISKGLNIGQSTTVNVTE